MFRPVCLTFERFGLEFAKFIQFIQVHFQFQFQAFYVEFGRCRLIPLIQCESDVGKELSRGLRFSLRGFSVLVPLQFPHHRRTQPELFIFLQTSQPLTPHRTLPRSHHPRHPRRSPPLRGSSPQPKIHPLHLSRHKPHHQHAHLQVVHHPPNDQLRHPRAPHRRMDAPHHASALPLLPAPLRMAEGAPLGLQHRS
jgi:hypothetical protein